MLLSYSPFSSVPALWNQLFQDWMVRSEVWELCGWGAIAGFLLLYTLSTVSGPGPFKIWSFITLSEAQPCNEHHPRMLKSVFDFMTPGEGCVSTSCWKPPGMLTSLYVVNDQYPQYCILVFLCLCSWICHIIWCKTAQSFLLVQYRTTKTSSGNLWTSIWHDVLKDGFYFHQFYFFIFSWKNLWSLSNKPLFTSGSIDVLVLLYWSVYLYDWQCYFSTV
jgi:hypothetical protein